MQFDDVDELDLAEKMNFVLSVWTIGNDEACGCLSVVLTF